MEIIVREAEISMNNSIFAVSLNDFVPFPQKFFGNLIDVDFVENGFQIFLLDSIQGRIFTGKVTPFPIGLEAYASFIFTSIFLLIFIFGFFIPLIIRCTRKLLGIPDPNSKKTTSRNNTSNNSVNIINLPSISSESGNFQGSSPSSGAAMLTQSNSLSEKIVNMHIDGNMSTHNIYDHEKRSHRASREISKAFGGNQEDSIIELMDIRESAVFQDFKNRRSSSSSSSSPSVSHKI
jgi:hypothetical protein